MNDPPIDCFYVYPTVSREEQDYADLTVSAEIQEVTRHQVGRLSSRCRVFVPAYRQMTLYHLRRSIGNVTSSEFTLPSQDVADALRFYFEHDNQGRGVVLIGHSQGSILLQAIMARGIDGTPAQPLMISAFLAGDLSLGVPRGRLVGGTFKHIPVCSSAGQIGCVYVWASYQKDDPTPSQVFGYKRDDELVSTCESPASPSGGEGALKPVFPRTADLGTSQVPFVEVDGAVSGTCRMYPGGSGLRVAVQPGIHAQAIKRLLSRSSVAPGWGLHILDIDLVQGNILDVIDAETATWLATHQTEPAAHPSATPKLRQ